MSNVLFNRIERRLQWISRASPLGPWLAQADWPWPDAREIRRSFPQPEIHFSDKPFRLEQPNEAIILARLSDEEPAPEELARWPGASDRRDPDDMNHLAETDGWDLTRLRYGFEYDETTSVEHVWAWIRWRQTCLLIEDHRGSNSRWTWHHTPDDVESAMVHRRDQRKHEPWNDARHDSWKWTGWHHAFGDPGNEMAEISEKFIYQNSPPGMLSFRTSKLKPFKVECRLRDLDQLDWSDIERVVWRTDGTIHRNQWTWFDRYRNELPEDRYEDYLEWVMRTN